jgi:hypothetical protein
MLVSNEVQSCPARTCKCKALFLFVKSSHLDGVKLINVQMTLSSQLELAFADHHFLSGHAQWDCWTCPVPLVVIYNVASHHSIFNILSFPVCLAQFFDSLAAALDFRVFH